jgi:outer membrane protein TolC
MKKIYITFLSLIISAATYGQESMMQDVSYQYLDKLINTAREYYPKYKQTAARVNIASAGVTKAKMSWFDVLNVAYIYNPNNTIGFYDNNTQTVRNNIWNGYQVGLYLNAGSLLQKPSIVRQAKEELNAAIYDKQTIDMNLEAEVKRRYFLYIQAQNMLRLRTKTVIDGADMLKDAKYKFEKGQMTFDAYNEILIGSGQYAQDRIKAESDLLIAKANLEELLGTKLENVK